MTIKEFLVRKPFFVNYVLYPVKLKTTGVPSFNLFPGFNRVHSQIHAGVPRDDSLSDDSLSDDSLSDDSLSDDSLSDDSVR